MTALSPVSQTFVTRVCALFRTRHQGRIPVLALVILGMVRTCSVSLPVMARSLAPTGDTVAQTTLEKRFRRWLSNRRVNVESLWAELTPICLADWAGRQVVLVFDGTPHQSSSVLLTIGIVQQDRVLPLAVIVRPQQTRWEDAPVTAIRPACERIAAAIPLGAAVTFLADQGLTGPGLIDLCTELGWSFTLRVNASASKRPSRISSGAGGTLRRDTSVSLIGSNGWSLPFPSPTGGCICSDAG